MRTIIAIITIIGVINGFQLYALAEGTENFERRYEDSLIARRSFSDDQSYLERRGLFGLFRIGVKAAKAVGTAIYNRKHNRRSYDELLEERDQLLELRDDLHGAHAYLAKRSQYDSLSNDIVKRLVNQKRGVDYLLELNTRDLVERDVYATISDLD